MTSSRLLYLAGSLCVLSFVAPAAAQDAADNKPAADLGGFVKEVMQMKLSSKQRQLAMWFPFEFFVESALAEGGKTRAAAEQDVGFLKPYLIVIVQCGMDDIVGRTKYVDEPTMRARAVLQLRDGTEIKPLEQIPPLLNAAMSAMKAMITSEGDAGSANMHVLVFPNTDARDKPIVNTSKRDKLTLVLKSDRKFEKTVFTWRTPFDAVTQVPPCSNCSETVSAKWAFCPFCGKKQAAE